MIKTLEPKNKCFSSALVMGAKLKAFEFRLKSILDRIGSLSIETLYILSGERKLDQDEIDALEKMGCNARDERDMMEFIAKKLVDESRKEIRLEIIKAPKKRALQEPLQMTPLPHG